MPEDGLATELHSRSIQQFSANSNARLRNLAIKDHGSPYCYSRAMKGSFGCVNAIALSKGAGTFIAYGGDDCRVLVSILF